ncbi:hypothetical protein, partial [Streptomyces sp. AS02]
MTTAFQTTSATTQGSISYALAGEARIADLTVQMNAIDESTSDMQNAVQELHDSSRQIALIA